MMRTGRKAGALTVLATGAALSGLACTGTVMGGGETPKGGSMSGEPMSPSKPGENRTPDSKPTDNKPVTPPPPPSADDTAGPAVFRRLTLTEYKNTLRDLLGFEVGLGDADFADDIGTGAGFTIGAKFVQAADANKFFGATEKVTAALGDKLAGVVPKSCNLTDNGEQDACVREFIDKFGLRAYRRPPTDEEKTDLFNLYKGLRGAEGGATFAEAMTGMVRAIIQSPQFLYRWELGEAAQKDGDLVKYNSFEVASRLSYFLWSSMPDDKLFELARDNKLNDLQTIANESRRLLADKRAHDAIRNFHSQWLDFEGMETLPKDMSFTDYNPEVGKAMVEETVAFATSILWGDKATGKIGDLFTSTSSFANAGLAKLYGVSGVSGTEMQPVALNPSQRAGILTRGSFLASHADGDFSHPVKRGVAVLRRVMCNPIPDPKGIDVPLLPERKQGETTREHFEQHGKIGGVCSGCHNAIDPLGFAFEHYNAVGGFRDKEEEKPINATGEYTFGSTTLKWKDAVELSKQLAESNDVRECVARHWVRFLLRREELKEETGSINAIMKAFKDSQWDMRELLVATTTTRAFTHRKLTDGEVTK